MERIENFRVLMLISNMLAIVCLIVLYFARKINNEVFDYFVLGLAIILLTLIFYLLYLYFRHEDLRKKKYDLFQLILRALIPALILLYFFQIFNF